MTLSPIRQHLVELAAGIMTHGRVANPTYDPAAKKGIHAIGQGRERIIPINRISSTQAMVRDKKVRRLQGIKTGSLPTVERQGKRFVLHDGNHRVAAAIRNGATTIKVKVQ